MNTDVRDNLTDLDARTIVTPHNVNTSQSTASTTYTDLATGGPTVTLTTGTRAVVILGAGLSNNTVGARASMSFAISGATTLAANDINALYHDAAIANHLLHVGRTFLIGSLTPGSNTFTAKYRASSGTATFFDRELTVFPGNKLS